MPAKPGFIIDVPAIHAAALHGVANAGWKQRVTVGLEQGSGRAPIVFEGQYNSILTTTEKHAKTWSWVSPISTHDQKISLIFEALHPNGKWEPSRVKFVETKVNDEHDKDVEYATYYTFYAEDGFDTDENDTTLTVAIVPTTKPPKKTKTT